MLTIIIPQIKEKEKFYNVKIVDNNAIELYNIQNYGDYIK